jgi:hypothetical protein
MSRKYSRYEVNQLVKAVLVRNAVDLSALNFSSTEHSAYFSGELKKDPRGDLTRQQIAAMLKELEALPTRVDFSFDLNNWKITQRYGSWEISQSKKVGVLRSPDEKPYVIKDADGLESVLLDMINPDSGK